MNCREFRRKHDAYVDDTLSGLELDAMARHRSLCERCAQVDTRVRRALLVAHNLPMIQPSSGFAVRLQARLSQERALMAAHGHACDPMGGAWHPFSAGAYTALSAALLLVAGLAAGVTALSAERETIRLAPVVASRPESEPSTLANPVMVASMPAGMPVWPAVFVAQQAQWHFASDVIGR